jgi:hypothetical protein
METAVMFHQMSPVSILWNIYCLDKTSNHSSSVDIVFTGHDAVIPDSALDGNFLTNFNALQTMGDGLMNDLVGSLGLNGGGGGSGGGGSGGGGGVGNNNITVTVDINGVVIQFVPAPA